MHTFALILGFVLNQTPTDLNDVIVWTFNTDIYSQNGVNAAAYVGPQYCKRAWFKNDFTAYNYFADPAYSLWTIPPILNDSGALFEGGVQVACMDPEKSWPCDNEYDDDHAPPYEIPDPVFDDFATRTPDDSIYWVPNTCNHDVCHTAIANENYRDFVLYWSYEQIDANVNALEFDEIGGGYDYSFSGVPENNRNEGYDDYALGIANFANRLSVVCGHGMVDPIDWMMPQSDASSELDSAKHAFDDDVDTYWMSLVSDSHWIEIDLQKARTVQQVCLFLHHEHVLEDFSLKYWSDLSGWEDFTPPINIAGNSQTTISFLVEPVPTGKIRLSSPDSQAYLSEMQVFGQGFRQFLLDKYCADSGWSATDPRWETEKLVDLEDSSQCPDSTINTLNYREYLKCHNWTGNPFGGIPDTSNLLDPPNPLFLDWLPTGYLQDLVKYFFFVEDSEMVDVAVGLWSESYSYERRFPIFWKSVCDSVRDYANRQGKEVYITYNGSSSVPHYVDYLLKPMGSGGIFPDYPAPAPVDSEMTHLDGTQAQVNLWREMRESGIAYLGEEVPVVAFLDFGHHGMPFTHLGGAGEPADERMEYLRIYSMEMYAAGVKFCFPVIGGWQNSWGDSASDGTAMIEVIKELADFLNEHKQIYQDVSVSDLEGEVTVNGIIPFNGEWNLVDGRNASPANDSKVTISYVDSEDSSRAYLHIINHYWDSTSHRMMPQSNVPVDIPVRDSCIMVRVISPDFPNEDTLSFTYQDSTVKCTIPDLAYYDVLVLDLVSTGVEQDAGITGTCLHKVYPNPFAVSTAIRYSLGTSSETVSLCIYNLAGQLVKTLANGQQKAGTYSVTWNSGDDKGKIMPSGIYFVKLKAGNEFSKTKKLLFLR